MITEISLTLITGVVIALVQVAKTLGLSTRWCPLVAIALGVGGVLGLTFFQPTAEVIFTGITIGLSAVGLFSATKSTLGK